MNVPGDAGCAKPLKFSRSCSEENKEKVSDVTQGGLCVCFYEDRLILFL
jgi:hypothetical protein